MHNFTPIKVQPYLKLVAQAEEKARNLGFEAVVVHCGPRNKEKGWPFWTKRYGEPTMIPDFYGPGIPTAVWQGKLKAR